MATSNRTSMTIRGLGSWRGLGGVPEPGAALWRFPDAATCHAVERRDAKIDPVPPGMPTNESTRVHVDGALMIRASKGDGKQRVPVITAHEQVEHYSGRARDHHGAEQGRPTLFEECPDVFVSEGDVGAGDGPEDDDPDDEKGCQRFSSEDEKSRHDAEESHGDEVSEA